MRDGRRPDGWWKTNAAQSNDGLIGPGGDFVFI